MSGYVIAHDIGTSGNKATLFTMDGKLIKSAVYAYDVHFLNPVWVEQNPEHWWRAFCETNRQLLVGVELKRVVAVSFSGQMMGCLCVDKNGVPLRNSIIWADMRAHKEQTDIETQIDPLRFYHLTGHRISSSYSVEKLMWIKNNEPHIYRETYKFLNAKDYLICKLTGRFVTDCSDASGTNVFDINTLRWSEELVGITGIDADKLPEILPSTEIVGEVTAGMSAQCGLPAGTKIVVGGGDGMCASVGAGSVSPGVVYNCLGTSSWICTTTEKPVFDSQMRTFNWAHVVPGMIGPCGTMQAAGLSYSWAVDTLYAGEIGVVKKKSDMYEVADREVASAHVLANSLMFLPYLAGERSPRWNPNAKGTFVGLTSAHGRAEMMRSVVEGVAMNLGIILETLREHMEIQEIAVIGGLAKSVVVRQILADVFNTRIKQINHMEEATSIGAAVIAGVGTGELKDFSEVNKFISIDSELFPNEKNAALYRSAIPLFNQVYHDLTEVFDKLSAL